MSRSGLFRLALVLPLLAGLLRWPSLDLPLDRDEGEYATLAWLWAEGHGVPYRDWLQQKPPAAIAMNAVAQAAFRDGVAGLRWLSLVWTAATVLLLALLALAGLRRWGPPGWRSPRVLGRAGWAVGLGAALLLSSSRTQSLAANTEAWVALPLGAALGLALGGPASPARWLASGCLLGLASLFKQPALAGLLLLPWAAQPGQGRLLGAVAWTSLGAGLPWALVLAVFAAQGAAWDLLYCVWAYNQGYVLQGWDHAGPRLLGLLRWLSPEWGVPVLLAGLGWRDLGPGPLRRGLGAWLALGAAFFVSGRFYPHYSIVLLAPVALLAGLALAAPLAPRLRLARGLLAGLGFLGWLYANVGLWVAEHGGARSVHLYGIPHFAGSPAAARALASMAAPEQPVLVWGDEPQLYYLARRVPASRFLYTYPFTGEAPAWPDGEAELRAALHAPRLGAVVLAKPLDAHDPLQREVQAVFQSRFQPDHSSPPFILGRPLGGPPLP